MCSAICCLTRHLMDGGVSRQTAAGGSVVPVLRDTSSYTLAVIFNLLSPLLLLLFSLFSFSSSSRAGRRRGVGGVGVGWGGVQSAANRSLGSCLLLIFWERCRLVVLFRRTAALVLKLEVLLERRVLSRSSAGERLPAPTLILLTHAVLLKSAQSLQPIV